MIPITADKRLEAKTKDGAATLFLRYLTGEYQENFLALQAMQGAKHDSELATMEGMVAARRTIDIFLAGWEGKDWPPFPADGKPGECFRLGDLMELSEIIGEHITELTGISVDESKNSQRRPSSPGTGRQQTDGAAKDARTVKQDVS